MRRIGGCLLAVLLLSGCGISQADVEATRAAGDALATQQAPTAVPTAAPVVVHLESDGSGEYASLAEAVEAVPEGSTIRLGAGTFLIEPLEIDKPLHLAGAGIDETVIVSDVGEFVVRYGSSGLFAVEDVAFRYGGSDAADVVVVQGGEIEMRRIRFSGAVDVGETQYRAGLRMQGVAAGLVSECVFEENDTVGLYVGGLARPTVEWSVATNNTLVGIHYDGSAGGLAQRNESSSNQIGIVVAGLAEPALDWNLCTDNLNGGIVYLDEGGGRATANECLWNGSYGISVMEKAQPTLQGNLCTDNPVAGIAYFDDAGGTARENWCWGNTRGIQVGGRAQPTLEQNQSSANDEMGIVYLDESGGLAYANECLENGYYGIAVAVTATPNLVDNVAQDNLVEDVHDERQ